jgi:hypothetical protein
MVLPGSRHDGSRAESPQEAADTRRNHLGPPRRLFFERGFDDVTVGNIAQSESPLASMSTRMPCAESVRPSRGHVIRTRPHLISPVLTVAGEEPITGNCERTT